jgi:hypothetical protein
MPNTNVAPGPGKKRCEHCGDYFAIRAGGITKHRAGCVERIERARNLAVERQRLDAEFDGK